MINFQKYDLGDQGDLQARMGYIKPFYKDHLWLLCHLSF